jgi:putative hydrolase of the HAD superfamily
MSIDDKQVKPGEKEFHITTLFLDIGNVLLSDGWDHESRKNSTLIFNLDHKEMEERHSLNFEIFEQGKITLDEYLERVVFYEDRSFTPDEYKTYMYEQSKPYPEMIEMIIHLKKQHKLKVVAVSNEARELNDYRIKTFKLDEFIDFFVSSCFVHLRKPDTDIFLEALDMAYTSAENVLYIDDQLMFVEVARTLGINSIHHTDRLSTIKKLDAFGLTVEKRSAEYHVL